MKQTIIGILLLLGGTTHALACDICGCATSAFTVGMLPTSKYHLVGMRTTFRWFESQPAPDGHGFRGISKQFFTSTDLMGRFRLGRRWQVQAFIPFVHNQKMDSVNTSIQGVGDAVFMGNFVFVDNMDSIQRKLRHAGTIGLGVKAPTGQFFKLGFDEVNMLPGTGSTDFMANVNYAIQYKQIGLQNETGFTYKTENKYKYRFGNALNVSQLIYYRMKISENISLVPQLGVNFTHNWKDRKNGLYSEDSFNGGNILNVQANWFIAYKNWNISGQVFVPIQQKLNENLVKQKAMIRFGINYFIKSKK
ncbi:MAG: hypothetical protein WC044_12035 [Crocinitomicaceae bacterium]